MLHISKGLTRFLNLLNLGIHKQLIILLLCLILSLNHLSDFGSLSSEVSAILLLLSSSSLLLREHLSWLLRILHHLLVLKLVNLLRILTLGLAWSAFNHRLLDTVAISIDADSTLNLLKLVWLKLILLLLLHVLGSLCTNSLQLYLLAIDTTDLLNIYSIDISLHTRELTNQILLLARLLCLLLHEKSLVLLS